MYTKQEFDKYAAMLRESGLTSDAEQDKTVLDFVYRLSTIAADIYMQNLNNNEQTEEE